MKRFHVFAVLGVAFLASLTNASYSGPFLFWGMDGLDDLKVPSLQAIDDKALRDIYSSASSIVIFVRNSTTKLNHENFPKLSEIVNTSEWLYLPQKTLSSDPIEYNPNAEVFVLTGPVEQQDVEIAALYRDAQVNYGKKNILGVLATRNDNLGHSMIKRQAPETTTEMPSTTPSSDEPVVENLIYAADKALLYTEKAPVLTYFRAGAKGEDVSYNLTKHAVATFDGRPGANQTRLIVKFTADKPITIRFVFYSTAGNWDMSQVEVVDTLDKSNLLTLKAVGHYPSAPTSFSYGCNDTIIFKNRVASLTLSVIQVEPNLKPENNTIKFSRVWDCVGIMTPGIISGIFVTFIFGIALTIAITAILDIKPPNRFESRSSKQLTFAVQE